MSAIHSLMAFRCGDNWVFSGPLNDANGNPLPLTNATITWKLDSLDGKTTFITLSLNAGILITNLTTASVLYGPSATQTSALIPGTYYDSLHVVLADGETYTVVEGIINALPPI